MNHKEFPSRVLVGIYFFSYVIFVFILCISTATTASGYGSDEDFGPTLDRPYGISLDGIKGIAKKKGLVTSGNRFSLVLRILESDNGVGAPKRARGDFNETTGEFVPRKREKSMKIPDMVALQDRIERKISVDKYSWGNQRFKDHCTTIVSTIEQIIANEIQGKKRISAHFQALNLFIIH